MLPQTLRAPRLLPSALLAALFLVLPPGGGGWVSAQESDEDAAVADSGGFAEDSADAEVEGVEEIVVTGSRIPPRANVLSSSPVTQVDADEFLYQGVTRVEDLLNDLPQVFTGQQAGQANGATGTATVNLRNLGPERTLVLLDGRRLPSGSPLAGAIGADANQIPGALVRQVEVLTGGASAAYGSDAVAGVVNFIMVDDFEGMRLDYQYSYYEHNNDHRLMSDLLRDSDFAMPDGNVRDGQISDFSVVMGANLDGGRGNVTAYATYRNIKPILQSSRDYSACSLNAIRVGPRPPMGQPDNRPRSFACGGSSTIPTGRFVDFGTATAAGALISGDRDSPAFTGFDYTVGGAGGDQFVNRGGLLYNFGPLNFFQRPDTRYTAGVFSHYDVSDRVEAYLNLMFMDDRTNAQIAPSGAFFVTTRLNCNNPFLSAQQFQQICGRYGLDSSYVYGAMAPLVDLNGDPVIGDHDDDAATPDQQLTDPRTFNIGRRNVEGGPRNNDLRHTTFRGVFGTRGDLDRVWSYDLFAQFTEVSMEQTYNNDLSITRIARALNVVPDPRSGPNMGQPVCQSVLDNVDEDCVPWNIFQEGGVTQAAINYLTLPLYARGTTEQAVFSGYVTGDLGEYGIKLPTASDGIEVVFGLEYRREFLGFYPDNGYASGDGAGQGGPTSGVEGRLSLNELFLEISIPLIEGAPFAEALFFDFGYRYSDYSTNISTNTYKFASSWNLVSDLKLRGSFQRAVRHANIRELFRPLQQGLFDLSVDPCAGAVAEDMNGVRRTSEGRTLEECMRTGVTPLQFGNIASSPANQYNETTGGNASLQPEESDTFSFGVVWTPAWLSGLTFSADYFDIDVQKAIDNISSEFILDQCLDTGEASFCDAIRRGPITGTLWVGEDTIVTPDVNIGFFQTSGFDIVIEYDLGLGGLGELNLSTVMTYLTKWDQQEVAGSPVQDCKGKWGGSCGTATPEFVNNFRANWISPWNVVVSLAWRHIGAVDDLGSNQTHFGEHNYFDMAAIWNVNEDISLRLGAQNLLDANPPITADAGASIFGNGNTFPGVYDVLGRYVFIGASIAF